MAAPRLSRNALKLIDSKIEELFDRLKGRALGPSFGRRLYIGYQRALSLPGIYEQAVSDEGGKADLDLVERLIEITNDLLDKHKAGAKAAVKKRIQDFLHEVADGNRKRSEFKEELQDELHSIWGRVTNEVKRVIATESQHSQTMGIKQGIDEVNAVAGINDPIVFFIPVKDKDLCDECRRLHLMPDGVTPRVWHSSEVQAGYHVKGVDRPSWSLPHPRCRCTLTTLLPSYGFDRRGRVTYKGSDHNELENQRE